MTHPRRIIREAVRDALLAANTSAQDRVWASIEAPVDVDTVLMDEGPVILVYTRRDRVADKDGYSITGTDYVRRCVDLVVEATAAGAFIVDDKLDALAEAIEDALDNLEIPGMPAAELRLVETNIDSTDGYQQPVGGAMILYEVHYFKAWRVAEPEESFPFPTDVGVAIGNGPREVWPMGDCCGCDD